MENKKTKKKNNNNRDHKVKYDRPGECSPEKDCLR